MNVETTGGDEARWAEEELGRSRLGNKLRTARLVSMAKRAAQRPAGRVTEVLSEADEREGAYRLLENPSVRTEDLTAAAAAACADRAAPYEFVYVPVDQTTLNFTDADGKKGLGPIGDRGSRARGLHVMSAIAVSPDGCTLGVFGQSYWGRPLGPSVKATRRKRQLSQKETQHWLTVMDQGIRAFEKCQAKPWFQCDRGGDFREMLQWARDSGQLVTVRAAHDRRTLDNDEQSLRATLDAAPVLGTYEIWVPPRRNRSPGRMAVIQLSLARVTLLLRDRWRKKDERVTLTAVLAREISPLPKAAERIEWRLLTNKDATSFDDARAIVYAYSRRWRVEEFHKVWKSTCKVQDSQLRSVRALCVWASILASVAVRIQRLTQMARTAPEIPASGELRPVEIEALIRLKEPAGFKPGDDPPLGLVVRWIAELGGYTGRSSGGPPGQIVIGRGLEYLKPAVAMLEKMSKKVDQ